MLPKFVERAQHTYFTACARVDLARTASLAPSSRSMLKTSCSSQTSASSCRAHRLSRAKWLCLGHLVILRALRFSFVVFLPLSMLLISFSCRFASEFQG